mmetsp:Transcript_32490/g.103463  ORF Transcript_32490/g.103463 Transcript_32490/m.103463 type:complete len:214 (-) Transcript_32490:26-667(-)
MGSRGVCKKWDREEYAQKAEEREAEEREKEEDPMDEKKRKRLERDPLHNGTIVARAALQQRDYDVDLESRLGKTQVVSINTPLSQQAGYYCTVCECIVRDSANYLDHINGKKHQRALGMSMRVERVGVDRVKQRLEDLKARRDAGPPESRADTFDSRVTDAAAEEDREAAERRERKKQRKEEERRKAEEAEAEGMDPEMAAMMGFGGFGSSKG